MSHNTLIGWDIGGAHLKAAVINSAGQLQDVYQQPCPLWQGLQHLQQAVARILQDHDDDKPLHALTMTGELVDLFADREDGVRQILATMASLLGPQPIWVFAGVAGFLPLAAVNASHYAAIASANWLASATYTALAVGDGLFVDIGSTTTDILALKQAQVVTQAYTDYQRLQTQELVYTGVVRTAVMAVAHTAIDQGQEIGLMAEYFATMADVYRVTLELDELHDQTDTADGAEKSVLASARRLSRMLGSDFVPEDLPRWRQFAQQIRAQQLQKIHSACEQLIATKGLADHSPMIGAGVGRFLVRQLADTLGRPYIDFTALLPSAECPTGLTAADCAPAVAVAYLIHFRDQDTRQAHE